MSGGGQRALRVGVKEEGKQDSSGQFQVWNLGTFGSRTSIKNSQTTWGTQSGESNQSTASEGVQNRPPQGVLLWHVNYFDLKSPKTLQAQKKLLP